MVLFQTQYPLSSMGACLALGLLQHSAYFVLSIAFCSSPNSSALGVVRILVLTHTKYGAGL